MKKYKLNLLSPASSSGSGKLWEYRGFIIKQWDNDYLDDPEIRGYQYNVYRSLDDYKRGSSLDILSTMKNAKAMIDGLILQESKS